MAHKLVGFAHSGNLTNTEYIKDQLQAISNEFDSLATEFADETDSRLQSYCRKPNRLPCLMLFKNDTYKSHIQAKLSFDRALAWVNSAIG